MANRVYRPLTRTCDASDIIKSFYGLPDSEQLRDGRLQLQTWDASSRFAKHDRRLQLQLFIRASNLMKLARDTRVAKTGGRARRRAASMRRAAEAMLRRLEMVKFKQWYERI
jgi:hypothetical protein